MSFREKWISVQSRLLAALDEETFPFGREESEEFQAYLENYEATLEQDWAIATLHDILIRAKKARVVLVGDYHTHAASANTVLWLLRQAARLGRRAVVFLEALPDGHQRTIDAYAREEIGEEDFLAQVGYTGTFGFDWSLYRPIVREAGCRGVPVRGINTRAPAPSLTARTAFAAAVVARHLAEDPSAVGIVLMGEKHMAPGHLPRLIESALEDRGLGGPVVTVHRNSTSAYFNLLNVGYDGAPGVFRSPSGRFLIQDVSPLTLKAKDLLWFNGGGRRRTLPDSGHTEPGPSGCSCGRGDECACDGNCSCGAEPQDDSASLSEVDEAGLFGDVLAGMSGLLALGRKSFADYHIFTGDDLFFFDRFAREGMDESRYSFLRTRAAHEGYVYVPEYGLAYMRELAPDMLGSASAQHLATGRGLARIENGDIDAVRGALGAALIDPFSAHEPLTPIHPALKSRQQDGETEHDENEGAGLGRRIFQDLASLRLAVDAVRPLFGGIARAKRLIRDFTRTE